VEAVAWEPRAGTAPPTGPHRRSIDVGFPTAPVPIHIAFWAKSGTDPPRRRTRLALSAGTVGGRAGGRHGGSRGPVGLRHRADSDVRESAAAMTPWRAAARSRSARPVRHQHFPRTAPDGDGREGPGAAGVPKCHVARGGSVREAGVPHSHRPARTDEGTRVACEETEHYRLTRRFLDDHQGMLDRLLRRGDGRAANENSDEFTLDAYLVCGARVPRREPTPPPPFRGASS